VIELAAGAGRISDKPGHDRITVAFTPRHAQPVGYYQLDFDGSPIVQRGLMAGRGQRCGTQRSLRVAPGIELAEEITYAQTGGPPDGTYPVDIHAAVDGAWL
jgi:hypothetical protein